MYDYNLSGAHSVIFFYYFIDYLTLTHPIMKFILMLTLIAVYECMRLEDLRNRLPIDKSDMIEYMEKTSVIFNERDVEHDILNSPEIKSFTVETVSAYLSDMDGTLMKIFNWFGKTVLRYIKKKLFIYCNLVINSIDNLIMQGIAIPESSWISEIRFDKNRDFCFFPFLFNSRFNIEIIFSTVYFFKTSFITPLKLDCYQLKVKLLQLIDRFYLHSERDYIEVLFHIEENNKMSESLKDLYLKQIKYQIFNFADQFCSQKLSPIESNDFLPEKNIEYYENEILGFIMKNEKCLIGVSTYTKYNIIHKNKIELVYIFKNDTVVVLSTIIILILLVKYNNNFFFFFYNGLFYNYIILF